MATYAIGDIQGCYTALQRLLVEINFDPTHDRLWSVGDLVNRGPQSLEVLRFFRSLGDQHHVVLGNHDLHLLAVAYGLRAPTPKDTLTAVLAAPDRADLMDWLRRRPLLVHDASLGYVMTHAGLAPSWDLSEAKHLAKEVELVLQSDMPQTLLSVLYGNLPDQWSEHLQGGERLRCIINYFTRMRFCFLDGRLELNYKGTIAEKPDYLLPWFEVGSRVNKNINIIFGHWSALGGVTNVPHLFPLDTGCVWGGYLTAMRLDDGRRFQVASQA